MNNTYLALDIDGVLVSDTVDFSKDVELNTFISGRLEPIFQIPKEIKYCLLTSRESCQQNWNIMVKFVGMLNHKPYAIYMERDEHEGRYEYKTRVMKEHPEITLFIESEKECIDYMIEHGIEPKRVIHWGTFIEVLLLSLHRQEGMINSLYRENK